MRAGDGRWTRRSFLQAASCTVAATAARRALAFPYAGSSMFAFVVVAEDGGSATRLQSYRVSNGTWRQTDEVSLPMPVQLSTHPALPVLYLRHDVALWDHLPRGAVSAYRLDSVDGTLTHLSTQPLSLAATHPTFSVVTQKGNSLFVATRAGIYNALPLGSDGQLLPVTAIRKEYGGAAAGAVHAVEHPDGAMLVVDAGQRTLSRFRFMADQVQLEERIPMHARQLALSGCGRWAYALHADDASVAVHRMTPQGLCAAHQTVAGGAGHASLIAVPCGRFLLRADSAGLSVLPLDPRTGQVSQPSETLAIQLQHLTLTPDGRQLAGFDPATGDIITIALQQGSRVLGAVRTVAQGIADGASLAFLPAQMIPPWRAEA